MNPRYAIDSLLPPGFRATAAIGGLLVAVGVAQLLALPGRDEPYPMSAAALALLLAGGGAVLVAFVRLNVRAGLGRDAASPRSAGDVLAMVALGLIAAATLETWRTTGVFFPARLLLAWQDALPFDRITEPPLAMMIAGTCLVALGAVATATLAGALWIALYARRMHAWARAIGGALSFAGAVPYVAFALVVRALICSPVALLAAGHWLALRPDEQLAYRSLLGVAPGLLAAAVGLGLGISRGLWSWLDDVRAAEESSDSFLAATVRGQQPWAIVVRQGLWLRRRRELGALLLAGMAAAVLIDILSNTLIDSFRPPGFPPYPSLGAALFLRGAGEEGVPAALPGPWWTAHVAVAAASLLLLLAQTVPWRPERGTLENGVLRVGRQVLARGIASAFGLPARPAVQWVLGASGAGKSTLLRAWTAQLPRAVLVPQDPDEALPRAFSSTDAARSVARSGPARADRVLWDLLGRLGDAPVRRRLFDPFTPVSTLSRGERQRLLLALALARVRADPACSLLLDEPTSAQDAPRTHAFLDCLRELLPAQFTGTGAIVLTSHDPEPIGALLGDRADLAVADHVLWMENQGAHALSVRGGPERRWERAEPQGLQGYFGAVEALFAARERGAEESAPRPGGEGTRVLRGRATIAGRPYSVSVEARIRGGEIVVLCGPSGCGKTTLLREIASRPPLSLEVGFVMQDAARAFPSEMPVREVLGKRSSDQRQAIAQRWFGSALGADLMARSIGALSEGERQRILLAAEVMRLEGARRTRLLLLDEPFGAADPTAHLRLMDALLGWVGETHGRNAAILVSHSPLVDLGLARASGIPCREWTIDGGDR
jgi:ABC-type cobalamin/Fe3+-siderophores transport system ATPase subunit